MKEASWNPPILSFKIERHGGMAQGSSRAEIQRWEVDLDTKSATQYHIGNRQKNPSQKALDVKPLAKKVVGLILKQRENSRLKWNADQDEVLVRIGKIIPDGSTFKQALVGRRKRFRNEVERLLEGSGWCKGGPNKYKKTSSG